MGTPYSPPGTDPTGNPNPPQNPPVPCADEPIQPVNKDEETE